MYDELLSFVFLRNRFDEGRFNRLFGRYSPEQEMLGYVDRDLVDNIYLNAASLLTPPLYSLRSNITTDQLKHLLRLDPLLTMALAKEGALSFENIRLPNKLFWIQSSVLRKNILKSDIPEKTLIYAILNARQTYEDILFSLRYYKALNGIEDNATRSIACIYLNDIATNDPIRMEPFTEADIGQVVVRIKRTDRITDFYHASDILMYWYTQLMDFTFPKNPSTNVDIDISKINIGIVCESGAGARLVRSTVAPVAHGAAASLRTAASLEARGAGTVASAHGSPGRGAAAATRRRRANRKSTRKRHRR